MSKSNIKAAATKAKWSKPQMVELNSDLTDVQNGFAPGVDGAGGLSTSLS